MSSISPWQPIEFSIYTHYLTFICGHFTWAYIMPDVSTCALLVSYVRRFSTALDDDDGGFRFENSEHSVRQALHILWKDLSSFFVAAQWGDIFRTIILTVVRDVLYIFVARAVVGTMHFEIGVNVSASWLREMWSRAQVTDGETHVAIFRKRDLSRCSFTKTCAHSTHSRPSK